MNLRAENQAKIFGNCDLIKKIKYGGKNFIDLCLHERIDKEFCKSFWAVEMNLNVPIL